MAEKKFSYDAAIEQIQEIVDRLEGRDASAGFDGMIADVQNALALIEKCKKSITEAEEKLAEISKK